MKNSIIYNSFYKTNNKALQKMIESYRINLEQKDILRKMKRR